MSSYQEPTAVDRVHQRVCIRKANIVKIVLNTVVVTVGNPGADVRPHPAGAATKSVADLHLELFLDETKKLAQSVVECVKENGVDRSITEVTYQCICIELTLLTPLVSVFMISIVFTV